MLQCLGDLFQKPPTDVNIEAKKPPKVFFKSKQAETRRNKIMIYISCDEFMSRPDLVLEEYYHVVEQWNKGRLSRKIFVGIDETRIQQ